MKWMIGLGILTVLSIGLCAGVGYAQDTRPRIAVVRFENRAQTVWQLPEIALAVQDLAIEELLDTGEVRVFEREEIEAIQAEHDLNLMGFIDPQTAIEFGRLIGVELLLIGRIETIDVREAGGGVSLPIRTPVGGVRLTQRSQSASVALNVRLIETETGEILLSRSGDGRSGTRTTRITVGWFSERIEGGQEILEAAQNALAPLIPEVVSVARTRPISVPDLTHYVVRVSGREIMTDLGYESGVRVADQIVLYREDDVIIHPVSGEVLGIETRDLAMAYITEVQEKLSRATIMETYTVDPVEVGDRVRRY